MPVSLSVAKKSDVKSAETGRMALKLYLEGLGFRATGRLLQIGYGTVYAWVKEWESQVDLSGKEEGVEFMELDEIHTHVGSKKLLLDLDCR
ncbi:hypothetical protein EZS27_032734 [termite gut metagenome]|uniref:Transposase n=1 Tax=termite gut metagenome TaxID=433724 RepID=A0A5J4Q8Y7_9ZZZZ